MGCKFQLIYLHANIIQNQTFAVYEYICTSSLFVFDLTLIQKFSRPVKHLIPIYLPHIIKIKCVLKRPYHSQKLHKYIPGWLTCNRLFT